MAFSAAFGPFTLGNVVVQVLANVDVAQYGGRSIRAYFVGACPIPPTMPLNLTGRLASPKPGPLPAPHRPSRERFKILHLSNFQMDPRE